MAALKSSGDSTDSLESEGMAHAYSMSDMLAALDNNGEVDGNSEDNPPPISYTNFPLSNGTSETNGSNDNNTSHPKGVCVTDESLALMKSAGLEIVDDVLYSTPANGPNAVNGVNTKPKPEPRKRKSKKSSKRAAAKHSVLDDRSSEALCTQVAESQPDVVINSNNSSSVQQEVALSADMPADAPTYELIGDQSVGRERDAERRMKVKDSVKQMQAEHSAKPLLQSSGAVAAAQVSLPQPLHPSPPTHPAVKTDIAGRFTVGDECVSHSVTSSGVSQAGVDGAPIYEDIGTEDDWSSSAFDSEPESEEDISRQPSSASSEGRKFSFAAGQHLLDRLIAALNPRRTLQPEDGAALIMEVNLDLSKHPPAELANIDTSNLSTGQLKRRHIVASIIQSERSYTATLQRLVEDYEKALLDARPAIIGASSVARIFHKVRDILQCHRMFHIELAEAIKVWDKEERIGNVFTASFSKSLVFDAYSAFVNNFSVAMETAKKEARTKQAFADFLKSRMDSAADKLSLFALMVKPVQRFPQFILLLQDLLKHTAPGHRDRVALQVALTELESLAYKLNESKSEKESKRDVVRLVDNTQGWHGLKADTRDMLAHYDVIEMANRATDEVAETRARRLYLLSDLLVCVKVISQDSDAGGQDKYKLKWAVPVREVEVVGGAIKSHYLVHSKHGWTVSTPLDTNHTDRPPQQHLDDMFHDLPLLEHVTQLVGQLRLKYDGLDADGLQETLKGLQLMIRHRSDLDLCSVQLKLPSKSNLFTFQAENARVRLQFLNELEKAKLSLDTNNSPAWLLPQDRVIFSRRLPLFMLPLSTGFSSDPSVLNCALSVLLPVSSHPGVTIPHLWGCGCQGEVTVVAVHLQPVTVVESFTVSNMPIMACTLVPGHTVAPSAGDGQAMFGCVEDAVWMATADGRVIVQRVVEVSRSTPVFSFVLDECSPSLSPLSMCYHSNRVYIGLSDDQVVIISRSASEGLWLVGGRERLSLGVKGGMVRCLIPSSQPNTVWATCGSSLFVVTLSNYSPTNKRHMDRIVKHHGIATAADGAIQCLVQSGVGLMVSFERQCYIRLVHMETFEHLQDVNVAAAVTELMREQQTNGSAVYITQLLVTKGLLWVGTSVGCVLCLLLPRLEGVPQVRERPLASYHRTVGPVVTLAAVNFGPSISVSSPVKRASTRVSGTATLPSRAKAARPPPPSSSEEEGAAEAVLQRSYDKQERPVMRKRNMSKWLSTPNLAQPALQTDLSVIYSSLMRGLGDDFMNELATRSSSSHHQPARVSWAPWANIQRNIPAVRRSLLRNRVRTLPPVSRQSSVLQEGVEDSTNDRPHSVATDNGEEGPGAGPAVVDEQDSGKARLLAAASALASPELLLGRTYIVCSGLGYVKQRLISPCDTNCSMLLWQCHH